MMAFDAAFDMAAAIIQHPVLFVLFWLLLTSAALHFGWWQHGD